MIPSKPRDPFQATLPDGSQVWLVTRYADVRAALADPRFSLDKRNAVGWAGFALPPTLDNNLLNMDPPQHTRIRSLVSRAFTGRRVAAMRPRVQGLTDELLDALGPGEADLIAGLAEPLPIAVIGELFGVPPAERWQLRDWTNTMMAPPSPSAARDAIGAISGFFVELIAARRAARGDDLLSAMIEARDSGDRLSEDELTSLAFLVLFAGYENSVNMIGNGVLALLRAPERLAELRADPSLLPAAVEELLRYDVPATVAIRRFPVEDLTIGGVAIAKGETVLLGLAAANHDPDRFADPGRLDLARADNAHVSLGHGIHYCLGAPLARMEGEVALGSLIARFPGLRLAVEPEALRWRPSFRTRALVTLPVHLSLPPS